MFEIKKGIPIPERPQNARVYPWEGMEHGDCFDVPLDGKHKESARKNVASQANKYRKASGAAFDVVTRLVDENTVLRVWLVKAQGTKEVLGRAHDLHPGFGGSELYHEVIYIACGGSEHAQ